MRLLLVSCALLVPACASSTATSPDGEASAVVGGAWEAPRTVADGGPRLLVTCEPYPPTSFPCRPLFRESWPLLTLAPSGLGLALWNRWDGSQFRLASARFTAGAWDAPNDVASGGRGEPESPSFGQYALAGDRGGNGLAVWRADGPLLLASRFTASGWSPAEPVGMGVHAAPLLPDQAAGLVVWEGDAPRALLWSRRDASGWTPPAVLVDMPRSEPVVDEHALALAPDGSAVVAWTVRNSGFSDAPPPAYTEVWTSRYTAPRGWDAARRIARFEDSRVLSLRVAAQAFGAVLGYQLVSTRVSTFGAGGVWVQDAVHAAGEGDAWSQPRQIGGAEPGMTYADLPALALDARGNGVLAWVAVSTAPAQRYTIRAARFSSTTRQWEPPAELTGTPGFGDSAYPPDDLRVALSDAGNAVAVWTYDDRAQGRSRLWASHLVPAPGWSAPWLLREADDTGQGSGLSAPEAAMDASGNALVLWAQADGERARIWSARLVAQTR